MSQPQPAFESTPDTFALRLKSQHATYEGKTYTRVCLANSDDPAALVVLSIESDAPAAWSAAAAALDELLQGIKRKFQ